MIIKLSVLLGSYGIPHHAHAGAGADAQPQCLPHDARYEQQQPLIKVSVPKWPGMRRGRRRLGRFLCRTLHIAAGQTCARQAQTCGVLISDSDSVLRAVQLCVSGVSVNLRAGDFLGDAGIELREALGCSLDPLGYGALRSRP